jgi:chemotaxis protein MotB
MFADHGLHCAPGEGLPLRHRQLQSHRRRPNGLVIEGHTDAHPFRNAGPSRGYGNWELSADRANAARRLLHTCGLRPEQVVEVRGFADRKLLTPGQPDDPKNRRISMAVKFTA